MCQRCMVCAASLAWIKSGRNEFEERSERDVALVVVNVPALALALDHNGSFSVDIFSGQGFQALFLESFFPPFVPQLQESKKGALEES